MFGGTIRSHMSITRMTSWMTTPFYVWHWGISNKARNCWKSRWWHVQRETGKVPSRWFLRNVAINSKTDNCRRKDHDAPIVIHSLTWHAYALSLLHMCVHNTATKITHDIIKFYDLNYSSSQWLPSRFDDVLFPSVDGVYSCQPNFLRFVQRRTNIKMNDRSFLPYFLRIHFFLLHLSWHERHCMQIVGQCVPHRIVNETFSQVFVQGFSKDRISSSENA